MILTDGYLLNDSNAGPVAAQTKSGPLMPASQKSRRRSVMFVRICASTRASQPGRTPTARFLQTSQMEDDNAAEDSDRWRFCISVWIGHEPTTTKPARITAETSVSHASGCLLAKTMMKRPSFSSEALKFVNARAMPSS